VTALPIVRAAAAGALVLAWLSSVFAQPSSPQTLPPNPYGASENFGTLPAGRTMGQSSAVDVDSEGHVWGADRCDASDCIGKTVAPILEFDSSGTLLRSFGAGMFVYPHGIHLDRDDNVWVADGRGNEGKGHQVLKFSPAGELLLALGKAGVAGSGNDEFNAPADVITAPNGDIFVADGHAFDYGNARIVKFSSDGRFIKTWGRRGSRPGEIEGAHGLAMDSRGGLFVADRTNNRVQIFDQEGSFIAEWRHFGRPSGIHIDGNDVLYATDSESTETRVAWVGPFAFVPAGYGDNPGVRRGVYIGDALDGTLTAFIPDTTPPEPPAPSTGAEGIAVDASGVIYTGEVLGMSVKRYVRR
jgi:sugar lactone lactonase YvrE